ncbi:sigma-54-dependent transcriptional regulator [Paludibaculum fermentans]|uniref:sigma-54-dependent transcriptional regulator n=1 Tax=Paludibaculum fermentans TaxID=1473598 RepID=UPI003EC11496
MSYSAETPLAHMAGNQCEQRAGDLPRLLVADRDQLALETIHAAVRNQPWAVSWACDAADTIAVVKKFRPHLVLLDLAIPGGDGIQVIRRIHEINPETQIIVHTALHSTETAVNAVRAGAEDYLTKPLASNVLRDRLSYWLAQREVQNREVQTELDLLDSFTFGGVVGRSPAMLHLLARVRRVAPHFTTALVSGETGSGKELVARALHTWSGELGSFVTCNCASIVDTLFESELFGHKRGSFTGATDDRPGLVLAAANGTLFLDEIGEMPLLLQAKLLRLLQNREVRPLGDNNAVKVDLRIVAATNRDLRKQVADGTFREDLFFRLSTVHFAVPPLRERQEDLPLLIRHFLVDCAARYGKPGLNLSRRAELVLTRYFWPGNIRELENSLNYACMMAQNAVVDIGDLPDYLLTPAESEQRTTPMTMAEVEYQHALHVLQLCDGNRVRAAELLGIGRATLYRMLARHETPPRT